MAEIQKLSLDPDRPLESCDQDRLGYSEFATAVARAIEAMQKPDGTVIALHGAWGSGKSTVLNYIVKVLTHSSSSPPTIVRYNPWWLAGREDLAVSMMSQIGKDLKLSDGNVKKKYGAAAVEILGYAEGIAAAIPMGEAKFARVPIEVLKRVFTMPARGIRELKEGLTNTLNQQKPRVLVVIDDVDRLTSSEIRELFQVIKALGDLPYFVYLLAFDRNIVANALSALHEGEGNAYMAKIVQASFELPAPDEIRLFTLLEEQLEKILPMAVSDLYDKDRLSTLWHSGMKHFMQTPRNIRRYCNSVAVTFPPVSEAVNPIDFAGVEVIRVFAPDVYRRLASSEAALTAKKSPSGAPMYGKIANPNQTLEWLAGATSDSRYQHLSDILQFLFPALTKNSGTDNLLDLELRVCSGLNFRTYFQYALPSGPSGHWLRRLLRSADNAATFEAVIRESLGMKAISGDRPSEQVLDALLDYAAGGNITGMAKIREVLTAIFSAGDDLVRDAPGIVGAESYPNLRRILDFAKRLLGQIDVGERSTMLSKVLVDGRPKSVSCATWLVIELGQEHGLYTSTGRGPTRDQMIPKDVLDKLVNSALSWIRKDAEAATLVNRTRLPALLQFWQESSGTKEAIEWVDAQTKTDEALVRLLSGRCGHSGFGTIDLKKPIGQLLRPMDLDPWLPVEPTVARILRRTNTRPSATLSYAELHYLLEYAVAKFQVTTDSGNQDFQNALSSLVHRAKVGVLDTTSVLSVVAIARGITMAEMPSATDNVVSAAGLEVWSAADAPIPPCDKT
ncbi:MAG: hypothetical protein K1X39_11975 [Thermoflexales bacterium]|nr:hypothetical protein [Thermoflexales bacterium]